MEQEGKNSLGIQEQVWVQVVVDDFQKENYIKLSTSYCFMTFSDCLMCLLTGWLINRDKPYTWI